MATQVVIAGGGFGGFYAARALERVLSRESADVTLVNDANYMLYTPLLPGAAGATLDPRHVVVALRPALKRTHLVIGRVRSADPPARTVAVRRIDGKDVELAYDQLVVALGSVSRTLPVPGLAEHASGLKSLADAVSLCNHVLRCLDIAESLESEVERIDAAGHRPPAAPARRLERRAHLRARRLRPRSSRRRAVARGRAGGGMITVHAP